MFYYLERVIIFQIIINLHKIMLSFCMSTILVNLDFFLTNSKC